MRRLWTCPCGSVLSLSGAPLPMTGLHNTDAPVWILSLDVQMARCDCEHGRAPGCDSAAQGLLSVHAVKGAQGKPSWGCFNQSHLSEKFLEFCLELVHNTQTWASAGCVCVCVCACDYVHR